MITLEHCRSLDAADPLRPFADRFERPAGDRIFLDANSIGAMPRTVPARLERLCREVWTNERRRAWSSTDWLDRPRAIGAALAPLVGARPEDVTVADNTTVNLFKLLAQAWTIRRSGHVVVSERGNFPTDLYVLQGMARFLGGAPEIRLVDGDDDLAEAIDADVAVVHLSLVDYRSSRRRDMGAVNARAKAAGALTLWDLSHAAGAIPIDLMGTGADFAVSCGYKYLCGGPGAPALIWAHPDHGDAAWPAICGWMGHADTFAFAGDYVPMPGVGRYATGTPPVIANEAFWAMAEIWAEVDPTTLWAKHRALGDLLIALLDQECGGLGIAIAAPVDYDRRGGHVAVTHPHAGPVCEALVEAGVVSSFRKPDALRFGLGPLYLSHVEIWEAVRRLKAILVAESWRAARFQAVKV